LHSSNSAVQYRGKIASDLATESIQNGNPFNDVRGSAQGKALERLGRHSRAAQYSIGQYRSCETAFDLSLSHGTRRHLRPKLKSFSRLPALCKGMRRGIGHIVLQCRLKPRDSLKTLQPRSPANGNCAWNQHFVIKQSGETMFRSSMIDHDNIKVLGQNTSYERLQLIS